MMSYYTDIIPKSGTNNYLLSVNQHGEAVMYTLDSDGKPLSFAVGGIADVLMGPIKSVHNKAILTKLDIVWPSIIVPDARTWREALDVLSGPPSTRRRIGRLLADVYCTLSTAMFGYSKFGSFKGLKLTQEAIEWDKKELEKVG